MEKRRIKVSLMSGKLKGIGALNTSPLNNEFCKKASSVEGTVCSECYSIKMLKTFRMNANPCFVRNGEMLSDVLEDHEIPRVNDLYFRINAHGEFLNMNHVNNVMRMVKMNPLTFFGIWTKRADLINAWLSENEKPSNCNLIYSNPKLDSVIPLLRGFDKVFNVKTEKTDSINCHGSCIDCLTCYSKTDTPHINEVLK